jgi:hypothetical protein
MLCVLRPARPSRIRPPSNHPDHNRCAARAPFRAGWRWTCSGRTARTRPRTGKSRVLCRRCTRRRSRATCIAATAGRPPRCSCQRMIGAPSGSSSPTSCCSCTSPRRSPSRSSCPSQTRRAAARRNPPAPARRRRAHDLRPRSQARARRRLLFSTSFREVMSNPLHTRVPLGCLARGVWVNLTFDLTELTAHNFGGARFSRLESIAVGAVCKLRRIFTLRDAPAELLAEEVRSRQRLLGLPARRCAPAQLLEPARAMATAAGARSRRARRRPPGVRAAGGGGWQRGHAARHHAGRPRQPGPPPGSRCGPGRIRTRGASPTPHPNPPEVTAPARPRPPA